MSDTKIVAVFPGQISFVPQLGLQLLESSENVRKSVAISSKYSNIDMMSLLENPVSLSRPSLVQPMMTALCLGAYFDLHAHIPIDTLIGFADGEVAAWGVSGSITPMDAIRFALVQGRILESESPKKSGRMVAIRGDVKLFQGALELGREYGDVYVAGQYHPRECVFGGSNAAIQAIQQAFRGKILPVTGPWNTPLMEGAYRQLQRYVSNIAAKDAKIPIVTNSTGLPTTKSEELQKCILEQLIKPIQWLSCIQSVPPNSIFVTIGFHQHLEQLIRRNSNNRVLPATSISAIRAIAKRSK